MNTTMTDIFQSFSGFNEYALQFAAIATILLVGLIIGRMLSKVVKRLLETIGIKDVKLKSGFVISFPKIFSSIVRYIIYFISFIVVLSELGISHTILSVLLVCVVTVMLVTLVLGIKDFVPNLAAGFYLTLKNRIQKGMLIEIDSYKGEVAELSFQEIKIVTKSGKELYIPNSKIFNQEFIVYPKGRKKSDKK